MQPVSSSSSASSTACSCWSSSKDSTVTAETVSPIPFVLKNASQGLSSKENSKLFIQKILQSQACAIFL